MASETYTQIRTWIDSIFKSNGRKFITGPHANEGLKKVLTKAEELFNSKAVAGGLATLGEDGKVPTEQLPSTTAIQNNYVATTAPAATNDNTEGYVVGSRWIDVTNDNIYDCVDATTDAAIWVKSNFDVFSFALSDYATALTTGVKDAFNMTHPSKLIDLFIAVAEAPTGSSLIADLKKNGISFFTTKPSIDATEKTSLTAATPFVLNGTITFAKGDEVTGHVDQIGATNAGKALKGYLILDRK
ncbi:MAG: hypothetical protein WCX31_04460 [Salinivirgaceae bacterium]